MKKNKDLPYTWLFLIGVSFLCSPIFAQSGNIAQWGSKVHSQGLSIGPSWLLGGFTVAALAAIVVGSQIAYGLLSRLLVAAAILFGGGSIVSLLRNIFG